MTNKQCVALLIIAVAILVGGFFWLDLAGAQDRPGAITSAVNDTNAAGTVSISSREISIGTNLNLATLPQVVATAPSNSLVSVSTSNRIYIAVTTSNVFIGKAGLVGPGTNWMQLTGATF